MNFLKKLWARLLALDNQPLEAEISSLQHLVEELQSQEQGYKAEIAKLNHDTALLNIQIQSNHYELQALQDQLELFQNDNETAEKPSIQVNWTKRPYFPQTLFIYYDNSKNKNVTVSAQMTTNKFYKLYTDEMYNYVMNGMTGYENKTELEKVRRLRDLVCNRVTYHHDYNSEGVLTENWKLPIQTFYERKDDCDGMTSLWVTFCKIYGLKPNKVFNLTGVHNTTGHSFGGYLDDDNAMWIIECTSKLAPLKMKDSPYRCKGALNGLTNWAFEGVPLVEQF